MKLLDQHCDYCGFPLEAGRWLMGVNAMDLVGMVHRECEEQFSKSIDPPLSINDS